jgi:hypothetical protein
MSARVSTRRIISVKLQSTKKLKDEPPSPRRGINMKLYYEDLPSAKYLRRRAKKASKPLYDSTKKIATSKRKEEAKSSKVHER